MDSLIHAVRKEIKDFDFFLRFPCCQSIYRVFSCQIRSRNGFGWFAKKLEKSK